HLQDVVLVAGHGVAVLHLGQLPDAIGKVVRLLRVQRHDGDQRRHEQAEGLRVDLCPVTADGPGLFELANALMDAGSRQSDTLADLRERSPSLPLQRGDDGEVPLVEHPESITEGNSAYTPGCRTERGYVTLSS